MNRTDHPCFRAALVVLALGLVMFARVGRSQPVVGGQGYKFTEYYDPPHETQLKMLLEGARAQRLPDGRIQVSDAKYRTYSPTGQGEMTVEAPECFYNSGQRSISSSGPLHVQTADGKFSIEGEGFLWQQTNSTLLVSNQVHTIIHPELVGPQTTAATTNVAAEQPAPKAKQAPGIDIFSDQFEFAKDSGLGVYLGNVRVAGTNLTSTAGKMTLVLSAAERRLQTLKAEENVIIDYEKIHATAGQAFYSADTGLIQLTNQPTWRLEQRDGSGDELVFDPTNRIFRANGHARLNMPAQSMGISSFLSGPGSISSNSVPTTNHFVEVVCDNYELKTNLAVFSQDVRVSDRVADQLRGEMSCALLTLSFSGTNELQKMLAERQVVIAQQDNQFTAQKAEYTGTNGVLDLTGNPAWRAGFREGKGDLLRVHLAREEMLVSGNAIMKLPAAELGQSAFTALGKPKTGESKPRTNEFAVVYSKEYFLTPESALFRGNVRIEHPQMKWTCEEITMLSLPELGKAGRLVIAEPAVVFDIRDDQGRSFHGTGDKAVYTHRVTTALTNDIMELTGNPAMLAATNLVGRNKLIVLDLASHKVAAPGKYKLWAAAPEGAPTTFRPPKTGFTR
jgi:lipopolysaccharide export system protein LptA